MDPFAVDLQLLRSLLLPGVSLTLGRELMARVVSNDGAGHGSLSVAGMLLPAELPEELQAGQELKLQVRELTPDKVVFGMQAQDEPQPQAESQLPQVPVGTPMPPTPMPPVDNSQVLVRERHSSHAGGKDPAQTTHTVALRYEAPSAGAVDMYFVLTPEALHLQLTVAGGVAFDLAQALGGPLDGALKEAAERTVTVSIKPRYDPVDVYV